VPDIVVPTAILQHPQGEWSGIFNIPADFEIDRERKSSYPDEKILP
jgi:hypothetical protein